MLKSSLQIPIGYISSTYVSATEPVQEQPVISKPIEESVDSTPDSWAKDAVNNAMSMGILFGDDIGNLKLHKDCTRQEVIVFLYRLYKKLT